MSKELKPQIYYLIRRGWYGQVAQLCEQSMQKKGKEPIALYWHAFAMGMMGNFNECFRGLESFQSRRDLQYAVNVALLYFHKKTPNVDHEAVASLRTELSVAEDVTKEAGLVLAARFQLYVNNFSEAKRLAEKISDGSKILSNGGNQATLYDIEAYLIEQWSELEEMSLDFTNSQEQRRIIQSIDSVFRSTRNPDLQDADALMLWAKSRHVLGISNDVLTVLNQTISVHNSFVPALADKALLLASSGDWDQALDTAQRILDMDRDHIDALLIIAVHAFTQECQPHDAIQKLDDLDKTIKAREPMGVILALETAKLFSSICARQPRAMDICTRFLERLLQKNNGNLSHEMEAKVLTELGLIYILQGPSNGPGVYEKAMKVFREGTKKDPNSVKVLQGMILCQLCEGAVEDAESQVELLGVMHNLEDLGYEMIYLQSLIYKQKKMKKEHLDSLYHCRDMFFAAAATPYSTEQMMLGVDKPRYLNAFHDLLSNRPEFSIVLAIEFFSHMEFAIKPSLIPSKNALLTASQGAGSAFGNVSEATVAGGEGNNNMTMMNGGEMLTEESQRQSNSNSMMAASSEMEISTPMQYGIELLMKNMQLCPGMMSAYIELSRAYVTIGKYDEAARTLQTCLSLSPQSSSALIAMAFVEVSRFKTQNADRLLEQALACDFSIRMVTKFRLVKAIIRAQQLKFNDAAQEMESIMNLPEFGFNTQHTEQNDHATAQAVKANHEVMLAASHVLSNYADSLRLTEDDRVNGFVCYAGILSKERRMKEANKVLAYAKVLFAGSTQEVQVLIAASQLYVEKGDFDAAIRMLDKISSDSSSYSRAQMVKADIILTNNHDKEGFTKVFEHLVEIEHNTQHLILLGDAYLKILNPEAAIDALERAYKQDPNNGRLRAKIGRALIATHEYHRAVEFYESALRESARQQQLLLQAASNGGNASHKGSSSSSSSSSSSAAAAAAAAATNAIDTLQLSHDLAKLYLKLGRYESAGRILLNAIHTNPGNDHTMMKQNVSTFLLLMKIQAYHAPMDILDSLFKAFELQKNLLLKLRTNSASMATTHSDSMEQEKNILSTICEQIGKQFYEEENIVESEKYYSEALQYNPNNTKAILGLSKHAWIRKEYDSAIAHCLKIITATPTDRDAVIFLADLYMLKDETEKVMQPFVIYLAAIPNDYILFEKFIQVLRRIGKLTMTDQYLKRIEKVDRRCLGHPGYHYCVGLYARYTNDIGKAISEMNYARKDDIWGAGALTHMIELYLNPDQDGIWEEKESGPVDDITRSNISAAEELLKELRPISKDPLRVRVLESYVALATRSKVNVDRAMQNFVEMLDHDQDYLPAVLGMATGFMIEKNQHKARNLLKRVGKMEMSNHDGEDFEKANLLLAKFYIDKSKNDLAQEMCKKILVENKSCAQAWEILGLIFEKESNYEMAADAYQKAWLLEFEASASVGYKLAFSYLKCKRFVDSVDICEAVLKQYPDYPRITEEILVKALQSIRTANIAI